MGWLNFLRIFISQWLSNNSGKSCINNSIHFIWVKIYGKMMLMEWNFSNKITPSIKSFSNVLWKIISITTRSKSKQLKVESATEQDRKCVMIHYMMRSENKCLTLTPSDAVAFIGLLWQQNIYTTFLVYYNCKNWHYQLTGLYLLHEVILYHLNDNRQAPNMEARHIKFCADNTSIDPKPFSNIFLKKNCR